MKYYVLQATRETGQEIDAIAVTQKDTEKVTEYRTAGA